MGIGKPPEVEDLKAAVNFIFYGEFKLQKAYLRPILRSFSYSPNFFILAMASRDLFQKQQVNMESGGEMGAFLLLFLSWV